MAVKEQKRIVDGDGNEAAVTRNKLDVNFASELDIKDILISMLIELKIVNLHLSDISGNEFTNKDVEV